MKTVQTMKGHGNYQNCSVMRPHTPHSSYGTYVTLAPKVLVFPIFVQVSWWLVPQREVRKRRGLDPRTRGWCLISPFRERQVAPGGQDSGGDTEGAQVFKRENRRVGAGEPTNKGSPPHFPPTSPFSGARPGTLQPLVRSQGLCAEASACWPVRWLIVWKSCLGSSA